MNKQKILPMLIWLMLLCGLLGKISQAAGAAIVSAAKSLDDTTAVEDSSAINQQAVNLRQLQVNLHSSRPTIGFFYYSVACSCAAAKCNIAAAALDSIPELKDENGKFYFSKVDAYLAPEAESLYNIMVIPAIVYFDKNGKEINRLEWGTNRDAIRMLIDHPEIKQPPLD